MRPPASWFPASPTGVRAAARWAHQRAPDVKRCDMLSYVTKAFSLRMDKDVNAELTRHAERLDLNASRLVNRYVKEGLRMDKHPAVTFATTPHGRRAAVLAAHPRIQVIDLIATWKGEGQDTAKAARYLHIDRDEVESVLRYYAEYHDEIDRDLQEHLAAQQNYKRVLAEREGQGRRRAAAG